MNKGGSMMPDGSEDSQESQGESNGNSQLLRNPQLQAPDLRQRQEQDDQITDDRTRRVGDPRADLIDTVTRQGGVPQLLHGDADEDEQKGDADDPGDDEAADNVGPFSEIGKVEDAVIHEEDGQLGPDEVVDVEDFGHDEILRHQDDLVGFHEVGVDAHACVVHGKDEAHHYKVPALEITVGLDQLLRPRGYTMNPETYQGEDDEIVIPPEPLALESSTEQAESHRHHLQHRHGRDNRHGPWLYIVRVVSLESGQDRARRLWFGRHLGGRYGYAPGKGTDVERGSGPKLGYARLK